MTADASRIAESMIRLRRPWGSPGAGAISTIFWKRRWMLHSRSQRWTMSPLPSPSIWTSMCRARGRNCSMYRSPFPNDARASPLHCSNVSSKSSRVSISLVPRPPPPTTALRIMALPGASDSKNSRASSTVTTSAVPGRTGTSFSVASSRARILSPNRSSVSAVGPTKTIPASSRARANCAFSARKPYPGCTASQPVCFAALTTCSISR